MQTILFILFGLVSLVFILLIVALFAKNEYAVERVITIKQPKEKIFNYLKLLKNQDNFSKWALMDPNMTKEYRGTDGTVGFVSAWDSNEKNVGKGEQEIKKITEGERIDFEIRFIKPFPGVANANLSTQSVSANETNVKWAFDSQMKYPMNLMLLFMNMDKMIGNDLATGLSNLKNLMEK